LQGKYAIYKRFAGVGFIYMLHRKNLKKEKINTLSEKSQKTIPDTLKIALSDNLQ
jgi:hypothetical protein